MTTFERIHEANTVTAGMSAGVVNPYAAHFHLDQTTMTDLETGLVEELHAHTLGGEIVAAVVEPGSEFAALGRTIESVGFKGYDSSLAMTPYEDSSLMVYTVDMDLGKITHMKRAVLSNPDVFSEGLTGIETIDDRLIAQREAEKVDLASVVEYHQIEDIGKLLNLTSNVGLLDPTRKRPYALLSYKAIFKLLQERDLSHVFAYQNPEAIKSLGRLGVAGDPLVGGEFHLPETEEPGEYDTDYIALSIPNSATNRAAFTQAHPDYRMRQLIVDNDIQLIPVS